MGAAWLRVASRTCFSEAGFPTSDGPTVSQLYIAGYSCFYTRISSGMQLFLDESERIRMMQFIRGSRKSCFSHQKKKFQILCFLIIFLN